MGTGAAIGNGSCKPAVSAVATKLSAPAGTFLGASLDYCYDYARMADEIRGVAEFFIDTPPYDSQVTQGLRGEIPFRSASREDYGLIDLCRLIGSQRRIERRGLRAVKIFYLRNSAVSDVFHEPRVSVNQKLPHESWVWRA